MNYIVTKYSDGRYSNYAGQKTFAEIEVIEEKNGAVCYEVNKEIHNKIELGWTPSKLGGVITVTEPQGWLDDYKARKKTEQLNKGMAVFEKFKKDFRNTAADVNTKRGAFKTFNNSIITGIDNAALDDKNKVDDFVKTIKWEEA